VRDEASRLRAWVRAAASLALAQLRTLDRRHFGGIGQPREGDGRVSARTLEPFDVDGIKASRGLSVPFTPVRSVSSEKD